jgi:plastocyanin
MGRRLLVLGTLACALAWPSVAAADKRIEAGPSNKYTTPEVTIDQGEKLTFVNNDVAGHDVTATDKGPDGKPLFNTPIVNRGESAFVEGSQYLTAGHYAFLCSVHTDMKGTIHVTGNGTPKPRPGQPGGPAAGEKDTQAPALGVRLVTKRLRNTLRVRVSLDEAAHVTLKAVARPRAGGPLVTVATGTVHMTAAGVRRFSLHLTQAGRRALRRNRRLAIIVTARATDNGGNKATEAHGRTLRA